MAKVNVKQVLVEKGERYAFFGAAGLMLLLMMIGLLELNDSPDTDKFVNDVEQNTQRIKGTMNNPDARAPDLPGYARQIVTFPSVRMADLKALNFDPIAPPDTRRTNPSVKPLIDIQADFVWAKIPAYDIKDMPDGSRNIGVMVSKAAKTDNVDKEKQGNFYKQLEQRQRIQPAKREAPKVNVSNPMGMMGEGPAIGPMDPMGMMPRPNMGVPIEVGERFGVEYVALDPEKLENKRLALTIYPQRMVIIHAAFPYREQVLEIARALRFKDPAEVFVPQNDAAPVFRGFLIQRRILYPDKRVAADWHNLNYDSYYRDTIYPRTLGDHEDHPDLAYVKLPIESETFMPLPSLESLKGRYPDVRIPAILSTIQKAKDLNKLPPAPKASSKWDRDNKSSLFSGNKINQDGFVGQPKSDEFVVPKSRKGMGPGMLPEGGMGTGTAPPVQIAEIPEAVLLRLVDNDIIPGRLYQYRMKVLMQNPNWAGPKDKDDNWARKENFELVSQRQDAKRELLGASEADARIIEQRYFSRIPDEKARAEEVRWNLDKADAATPWFEMNGFVTVPQEEFFFAIDPPLPVPDPKDPKKSTGAALKPGEGLLQIQRWLPTANIKGFKEPVADWVVADVLAKRGYYLGGDQFVNLPIWSSEFNRYILRKVPADKDAKQKESKRGVVMDPTKPGPRYAVIDVEGGTISKRYGSRSIEDEAAAEVLLADEDGNLQVRSTAYDRHSLDRYMPDPNGPYIRHSGNKITRYQVNTKYDPPAIRVVDREEVWNKWVEDTDKASRTVDPDTGGTVIPPKKFD